MGGTHSVGVSEDTVIKARVQLVEEPGMEAVRVFRFLVQKATLSKKAL